MLRELTSAQLSEWQAYDRLDPIGTWRDDLRIASLESLITNIARSVYHDPKKGKLEHVSPEDFMMKWGETEAQKPEPKVQSPEEMAQALRSIATVMGTRDKIEKK